MVLAAIPRMIQRIMMRTSTLIVIAITLFIVGTALQYYGRDGRINDCKQRIEHLEEQYRILNDKIDNIIATTAKFGSGCTREE